ncbi:MAG: DUF4386 domain-containing protein [Halobacteriota archaeon]
MPAGIETTNRIADQSPRKTARMAGLFYLIFIVTLALSSLIRSRLIVFGDAAATANTIMGSELLFRIGFVTELVSAVFFLLAAWALFVLLKPVNKNLALLFLLLNLSGVAVECMNTLNLFAALQFLSGANYLNVFQIGQLQAMAMSFLNSYTNGFMIAQIFFGAWLLPLGYLVFKSGYLPRILGILLMIDFFGVLIWFFQFFLFPSYGVVSYPSYVVGFIAEFSLSLWLLIKGVNEEEYNTKKAEILAKM